MVRTLDQQASEIGVASLSDAELWVVFTGLATSWSETEIAAYVATSLEAFLVAERQHEGQGGDVANPVDLQQSLGIWKLGLCQLLDLAIVLLDLQSHLGNLLKHRTQRLLQCRRHHRQTALREASGGRRRLCVAGPEALVHESKSGLAVAQPCDEKSA